MLDFIKYNGVKRFKLSYRFTVDIILNRIEFKFNNLLYISFLKL